MGKAIAAGDTAGPAPGIPSAVTTPVLLEARALAMWRGERRLFHDLSLAAVPGRALHVRGPNGCGKTTLLRILCGLLDPEDGALLVSGQPVRGGDPRLRALVGYVGHADGLKHELAAAENLRFAAALAGADPGPDTHAALARMGLVAVAALEARQLSAGQRRRLALARLPGADRRLWILDEPFTALDSDGIALLAGLLEEALARGVAVIFTSHQAAPLAVERLDTQDQVAAA